MNPVRCDWESCPGYAYEPDEVRDDGAFHYECLHAMRTADEVVWRRLWGRRSPTPIRDVLDAVFDRGDDARKRSRES